MLNYRSQTQDCMECKSNDRKFKNNVPVARKVRRVGKGLHWLKHSEEPTGCCNSR